MPLKVPYVNSTKNGCATACAQMVSTYFFPDESIEDIKKILRAEEGFVTWAFPIWLWLADRGIEIVNYDLIDYEAWANKGIEGLKESVPEKEFEYYFKYTQDLNAYGKEISKLFNHKNFKYIRIKPTIENLIDAINSYKICECVLDSRTLDKVAGFSLHRVVVLGQEDNNFIIHDPRESGDHSYKRVEKNIFIDAWLDKLDAPELCIYNNNKIASKDR